MIRAMINKLTFFKSFHTVGLKKIKKNILLTQGAGDIDLHK